MASISSIFLAIVEIEAQCLCISAVANSIFYAIQFNEAPAEESSSVGILHFDIFSFHAHLRQSLPNFTSTENE